MFHAKTMRFRYRFLHKRRCYFMGLVFQSSFPLYYAFLWCWFVSVWVCKCVRVSVIKCVRSYMHPCSMPRPLGSNTGSCTNVAATLWVWFSNVFPCVLCLLTKLVCECVSVWVCASNMPRPKYVQIQILAQMLLLFYGFFNFFSFLYGAFLWCWFVRVWQCDCVSVCVHTCIHAPCQDH